MIPFHVPAFARAVSCLAWDVLLSQGTGLRLFSLLRLFWQKRKTLAVSGASSREGDLTAGTAQAFYLELTWSKCYHQWERVSCWNVLLMRGREGKDCPETAKHWLCCCPCYWQRHCFGAWIESLEIPGVVHSCCWFGIMFWSPLCSRRLALQGWKKVRGAQSRLRLTRGRSTERLSGMSVEQHCAWERNELWSLLYRYPRRCGKYKVL